MTTAAGTATLTIGTLADTAAHVDSRPVAAFRARHPHVQVRIHETDLGDPTAGLRAGLVDVALRLPAEADSAWTAYWTCGTPDGAAPQLRTIQECLQAVLWNGTSALAPLDQPLPAGLVTVPFTDRPPSRLVVAWSKTARSPLIRGFVRTAAEGYGAPDAGA
ncbi:LysR substrate-binding domain-containing protein [Nocardia nova]|uniref:LysR substrate-binding domain-containing protein n=1 Tax=Nocardia nova TaxID=37330 RepID=UPI001E47B5EB|nr:LysR substrate-binding domain-containing protein [Nocardia nova]